MTVEDYYTQGKRSWLRLQEKGGKQHETPAHHSLEEYRAQCQKAVICCTIASPILSISYVNRPQKRQAVSSKSW
jgi:hypothetical protein